MFARIKDNGAGGLYMQVVHSWRPRLRNGHSGATRQRIVATLGRVDHLRDDEREKLRVDLNGCLERIHVTCKTNRERRDAAERLDARLGYGPSEGQLRRAGVRF